MQRLSLLIALLLCHIASWARAYNPETVPDPKRSGSSVRYVSNPDGILSSSEVLDIDALCSQLYEDTQVELGVVAVNDIGDWDDYEFGITLFRHWGIGDKERNDGVLFLYVGDTHKMRINVGKGIEDVLTDAKSSRIINAIMIPLFKQDSIGQGLLSGVSKVYDIFTGGQHQAMGLMDSEASEDEEFTGHSTMTDEEYDQVNLCIVGALTLLSIIVYLVTKKSSPATVEGARAGCGCILILASLFMLLATWWAIIPIIVNLIINRRHNCPRCGRRCSAKRKTIREATYSSEGLCEVTWQCKHCGTFTTIEKIPRKRRSSSDDSSSDDDSDSGSSWGGGDSGGGGAGGSW